MGQKAHRTESIIDRNDDDVALREVVPEVIGLVSDPIDVASAVDPDHHGLRFIAAQVLRPDIQIEAVLANIGQVVDLIRWPTEFLYDVAIPVGTALQLRARGAEARSVLAARAWHVRLGRTPAQLSSRGGCVGDPAKYCHLAFCIRVCTYEDLPACFDDGRSGWRFRAGHCRCEQEEGESRASETRCRIWGSAEEISRSHQEIWGFSAGVVRALIRHPSPPLCRGPIVVSQRAARYQRRERSRPTSQPFRHGYRAGFRCRRVRSKN